MQIKLDRSEAPAVAWARETWRRRRVRIVATGAVIAAMLWSAASGALYAYGNRRSLYTRVLLPAVTVMKGEPQWIPLRWASGLLARPERIAIDMNQKAFMKLTYMRQNALAAGYLGGDDQAFVPATIRHGDQVVNVAIRLKGDWTDHLSGKKWSFRIKVKGDKTLFGMNLFSIEHPGTRGYIYEWLFHRALQREGIVALRYDFVRVALNGKDLGIYALEEHFDKRLIEHNRLREGPIVRFNEDLLWAERMQQQSVFRGTLPNGNGRYISSPIDGFQQKRLLSEPGSAALYYRAIHLLEGFRRGELTTSQAFDVPKLARYFALTDILGAPHATIWQNLRFYYNPITSHLEPIGFDANAGKPLVALCATINGIDIGDENRTLDDARTTFFHDTALLEEYVRTLERMSRPAYLDAFFRDEDAALREKLDILYSEFPGFHLDRERLYRNQRYVASVLNPVKGMHAYFDRLDGDHVELELGSIDTMPIEVLGVSAGRTPLVAPRERVLLPAKRFDMPVQYLRRGYALPSGLAWSDTALRSLRVQYRLVGASTIRDAEVFPWPYLGGEVRDNDFMRRPANWRDWAFLVTDEVRHTITIRPGSWTLDRSLILPRGYTVQCAGAAELNLIHRACILSYSPLALNGSEDAPVSIVSRDGTGQGLVVMDAGRPSTLDYVIFDNLTHPSQGGWVLTGAVTFYESPLYASHCRFGGNHCEDALNLVRTRFQIEESSFARTQSDAFDTDFCAGTMNSVRFDSLGNDAIDVSGTQATLTDIAIRRAGDKGVSAGEGSHVAVRGLDVVDSEIALASKDQSALEVSRAALTRCKIGATAYQKKPEYGPATMALDHVNMKGAAVPYLIEKGSQARVNGAVMAGTGEHIDRILYGVQFGKATQR